jgi:ammonium transporter, Amt family
MNATGTRYNDGDSSWVFTSTVLTLLMTPALAFFYGGLVDKKNVLNTLTLSFICIGVITIQWFLVGYSFVFQKGTRGFGSFSDAALHDWLFEPSVYAPTIPNFAHMAFQCAFAIIAPALMSGSVVGRIKFKTYVCFILLWSTFVYDVIAHWIWSENGWLKELNLVDYAGGLVVHLSSGVSALVATLFVGPRAEVGRKHEKHVALTVLGAGLLWVGWHGFNGGSAFAASARAALALFNTNLAAAGGMLTWLALDSVVLSLPAPRISSAALGFVVGLVGITAAAGNVHPGWALVMGVLTCACCWTVTELSRRWQWLDDTLDVFACHGVGGAIGSLLAGLFPQVSTFCVVSFAKGEGLSCERLSPYPCQSRTSTHAHTDR